MNHKGRYGGGAPERSTVTGRYKAKPEMTKNGMLIYAVVDTITGEWKHVYDCFLWAEKKAKELNTNGETTVHQLRGHNKQ